jgi:putative membrane protein
MKHIATLFLFTVIPSAFAVAAPYYCNYPFFMRGGGTMWLITIALFASLIYIFYKNSKGTERVEACNTGDIISILNKRLAKGEISEEDYDRLKSRISG